MIEIGWICHGVRWFGTEKECAKYLAQEFTRHLRRKYSVLHCGLCFRFWWIRCGIRKGQ
jgi:hypothetical protein